MKNIRSRSSALSEQPFFKKGEIERMCLRELRATKLLPDEPGPVRIDRFIEQRFNTSPVYEDLPDGVLGYTKFGPNGVEQVVISAQLDNDPSAPARRRLRSTLAHEAGHGLLHAHLFAGGTKPASLFEEADPKPHILCRDVQGEGARSKYDGRWWEFQANRAIGGLLLPAPLVARATEPYLASSGGLGAKHLPAGLQETAVRVLSEMFDVNPAVVRIRLAETFPNPEAGQLLL